MTLGWGVVGIAALIAVTGPLVATRSLQVDPSQVIFDWPAQQFLLVMYTEIALFATFVTIGVLNRKRPRIHRPMMLMACLVIASGATARIAQVGAIFGGHQWMGIFRAGGVPGIDAAGGARGHDAPQLRSTVCHGAGRYGGGDADRGKAGGDERVGRLGGDDPEAVTRLLLLDDVDRMFEMEGEQRFGGEKDLLVAGERATRRACAAAGCRANERAFAASGDAADDGSERSAAARHESRALAFTLLRPIDGAGLNRIGAPIGCERGQCGWRGTLRP